MKNERDRSKEGKERKKKDDWSKNERKEKKSQICKKAKWHITKRIKRKVEEKRKKEKRIMERQNVVAKTK